MHPKDDHPEEYRSDHKDGVQNAVGAKGELDQDGGDHESGVADHSIELIRMQEG